MKEDPIDIAQIDVKSLPQKEFPAMKGFRIFINRQAHEAVWEHARGSVEQGRKEKGEILEVGGVLLGNVYKDSEGPFLEITAALVAEYTKNEGTQMTFTPETWVHVNEAKAKQYPKARVVGWYHTHPRFGIFLSEMDKFIHKHHFSQPWTTALVVDPVQGSEGFFVWNGGEPSAAREYWVGSERREGSGKNRPEPMALEQPQEAPAAQSPPESPLVQSVSAVLLAVCFVALLFVFWVVFSREAAHSDMEKAVLQSLDEQNNDLQTAQEALVALANQMALSQKDANNADVQMQRQLLQAAAARLGKASLVSTLLQAKLANRQDVLDRIQAELSGAKPDDSKQSGQQGPGKQSNSDQNANKANANQPSSEKQGTDKPAEKQNKAPAEVKKQ